MTLSISCIEEDRGGPFYDPRPASLGQTENDLLVFRSFYFRCRKRDGADSRSARGEDGGGDSGSYGGRRRLAHAGRRDVALILLHHFRRRVLDVRVNLRRLVD